MNSKSEQPLSLRQSVFKLLQKNPYLRAKELCKLLDLPYSQFGGQVQQRRFEFIHPKIEGGSKPSNSPNEQHHITAKGYVPKIPSLDRKVQGVTDLAIERGWELGTNRNRVLVWRMHPGIGHVEWWEKGTVSVYVLPPARMDKVKKLLFQAFYESGLIFDMKLFDAFAAQFHWSGAHDVFRTGQSMPHKTITTYQALGFVIKTGDRSHPDSIEVEWAYPEWVERLEYMLGVDARAFEQWSAFMRDLSTPKRLDPHKDRSVV